MEGQARPRDPINRQEVTEIVQRLQPNVVPDRSQREPIEIAQTTDNDGNMGPIARTASEPSTASQLNVQASTEAASATITQTTEEGTREVTMILVDSCVCRCVLFKNGSFSLLC
jgi:hypothetical protein